MLRKLLAGCAAAAVAISMGSAAAVAAPEPSSGPTTGGTEVSGLLPEGMTFTEVAAGDQSYYAVSDEGSIYSWGLNVFGQSGVGSSESRVNAPTEVKAPEGVTFTSFSAGTTFALAVGSDGKTYSWGQNTSGQLGNGSLDNAVVPTEVKMPSGRHFTQVAGGWDYSLALADDGSVWAWGAGSSYTLGTGDTFSTSIPVRVQTPNGVEFSAVSAGGFDGFALSTDGEVYSWGYNWWGTAGNGTMGTPNPIPSKVHMPVGVVTTSLSAGGSTVFALDTNHDLYAWGAGGTLGFDEGPSSTYVQTPRLIPTYGVTFATLSTKFSHTLALSDTGVAYGWGINTLGQVGVGSLTNVLIPTEISLPDEVSFIDMSAGERNSVGLTTDGKLYAWGSNHREDMGIGSTESYITVPTAVQEIVVTDVNFGGLPATAVSQNSTNWSATTPTDLCGPVNIEVDYTLFADSKTQTHENGFFAGAAATFTKHPASVNGVASGAEVTLTAAATGDPAPALQWQKSSDGKTWTDISGATDPTLKVKSKTDTRYRVAATNCAKSEPVFSNAASVTIKPVVVDPPKPPTEKPHVTPKACSVPRTTAVFADTPLKHKFYKEIDWMHCMKYSTGWKQAGGKPVYKPQDNLQRQAMAAFIYRMEKPKNFTAPKVSPFADVKPGDPFYKEMAWMFQMGYSTGWAEPSGKPTYRPYEPLSREAMAAFIYRLDASKNAKTKAYKAPKSSPLADMKPGMKFFKEISWMYDARLTTGNKVGSTKEYWPKDQLSRQAMAAFIYRFKDAPATAKQKSVAAIQTSPEAKVTTVAITVRKGFTLSVTPLGDTSIEQPEPLTADSYTQPAKGTIAPGLNGQLLVSVPKTGTKELSFDVAIHNSTGAEETVRYVLTVN